MAKSTIQINIYNKLRILSIDIVLGALSGGIMTVKMLEVEMETTWWFVLALAVWIIYTADHLIDSQNLKGNAFSERRYFYYKHFCLFLIIEIILIILTVSVSFLFLNKNIIYFGAGLGIFVAIYLLMIQIKGSEKTLWLQKELIVALVYTLGIWGGPILHFTNKIALPDVMIIISFFLIVWADILIIAQFEIKNDQQDGFTSLPIIIGKKMSTWLIIILLLASVFILLFLFFFQSANFMIFFVGIILFTMSLTLLISLKYEDSLKKNERYRILAESVFFLPALMLFA